MTEYSYGGLCKKYKKMCFFTKHTKFDLKKKYEQPDLIQIDSMYVGQDICMFHGSKVPNTPTKGVFH